MYVCLFDRLLKTLLTSNCLYFVIISLTHLRRNKEARKTGKDEDADQERKREKEIKKRNIRDLSQALRREFLRRETLLQELNKKTTQE